MGIANSLARTFITIFRKPVTRLYPEEKIEMETRFRGLHRYVEENCIACGLCADTCPNACINVTYTRGKNGEKVITDYRVDIGHCMFCGLCEDVCPTQALTLGQDYELAGYDRVDDLIWDRDDFKRYRKYGSPYLFKKTSLNGGKKG
jgi:NADH-quinone oxidoreductase chain I